MTMIAGKFESLKKRWKKETMYMSSVQDISNNQQYQSIIKMGWGVIPLILEEMKRKPDHWFWALFMITGEDPVPKEDEGWI